MLGLLGAWALSAGLARSIPSLGPSALAEALAVARLLLNVGQPSQADLPPAPLHRPSPEHEPGVGSESAAVCAEVGAGEGGASAGAMAAASDRLQHEIHAVLTFALLC